MWHLSLGAGPLPGTAPPPGPAAPSGAFTAPAMGGVLRRPVQQSGRVTLAPAPPASHYWDLQAGPSRSENWRPRLESTFHEPRAF